MNPLVSFERQSCVLPVHARLMCCQRQPLILGEGQRSDIGLEILNRGRLVALQAIETGCGVLLETPIAVGEADAAWVCAAAGRSP